MFRSEPMQKVRLICLDSDKKEVISALHGAGIMDLRKSSLDLQDDRPLEHMTELSDMEIRLAGALAVLGKPKRKGEGNAKNLEKHIGHRELASKLRALEAINRIYSFDEQRKRAASELRQLQQQAAWLGELKGIDFELGGPRGRALEFKAYSAKNRKMINGFIKEVSKDTHCEAMVPKSGASVLVAYDRSRNIGDIASRHGLKELHIPEGKGTPDEELRAVNSEIAKVRKGIDSADSGLDAIRKESYGKLSAYMEMLGIEMAEANASSIFKRTDRTIIIEGWVPKKRLGGLHGALSKAASNMYYIEEINDGELAPTLMNRPKILQPFDYMVNFISVPRSDELDPAVPFIISFPIFYGLMISDVGYGIASFLFAWYITRITDPGGLVYNSAKIWQFSAIAAIFFGFLSNQYFGLQLNQYFTTFQGFNWFTNITTIILLGVIFGIIQVSIGLVFGFINKYGHHRKIAFSRLSALFLLISGSVAIGGALFGAFSAPVTMAAAAIAILSLVITIVLGGTEAAEVTNLISHPLSYARLMGFGLASVVIAFLIDKAFTPNMALGIPLFILYLAIFSVLHFMNMIVSMFEGAVQGARLNFVEFFTKFYNGGGVRFNPFSAKRVYTKE